MAWQDKRQWPERLQRARQEHRQWADEQVRAPGSNVWPASDFLVSVMVPSRGRPDRLRSTLANIRDTASHPERVEILVRLDDDDTPSLDIKDGLHAECAPCRLRVLVEPRGKGYDDIHRFFNEMAARAKGDYVMVFGDDGRFVTSNWLQAIEERRHRLSVLHFPTFNTPNNKEPKSWYGGQIVNPFPLMHRKLAQLAGQLSGHWAIDAWMHSMGLLMPFGSLVERIEAVRIEHDHALIKDQTKADRADTAASRDGMPPANAPGAMRERMQNDMFRVALYIEEHGRQLIPADQAGDPQKPSA